MTKDPVSRSTNNGKEVCNFSVAVNRRQRDQDGNSIADFFSVAAWGELGKACQKYLAKGRKVCVVGQVSVSTYQAQDGTTRANLDVLAQDVEFLSSRQDGEQATPQESTPTAGAGQAQAVDVGDELPF